MIRFLFALCLMAWASPTIALDAAAYTLIGDQKATLYFFAVECDTPTAPGEPPNFIECVYLDISCSEVEARVDLAGVSNLELSRWFAEPDGPASTLSIGETKLALVPDVIGVSPLDGSWSVDFRLPSYAFSELPAEDLAAETWSITKLDQTLTFPVSGKNRKHVDAFIKACLVR